MAQYRALYDHGGDQTTPPFNKDDILTLIVAHDSGWLEMTNTKGVKGYVSPSWVEEIVDTPPDGPPPGPPPGPPVGTPAEASQPIAPVSPEEPDPVAAVPPQGVSSPGARRAPPPVAMRNKDTSLGGGKAPPPVRPKSKVASRLSTDFSSQLAATIGGTLKPGGAAPSFAKAPPATSNGPPTPPTRRGPPAVPRREGSVPTASVAKAQPPQPPARNTSGMTDTTTHRAPRAAPPLPTLVPPSLPVSPPPSVVDVNQDDGTYAVAMDNIPRSVPVPQQPQAPQPSIPQQPVPQVPPIPDSAQAIISQPAEPQPIERKYEGALERKPVVEGGKELKKRTWSSYYGVLVGPTLYLYKDEKSRVQGKKPVTSMDIESKNLEHAEGETKKKNAFVLSDNLDRYVFNPVDETARACWISQLSKGQTGLSPSIVGGGFTKKTSLTSPPVQATAALPAKESGGKKYGMIRSTLNRYLSKRPAKEDLKERGIITEPVFGGFIEEQIKSESSTRPNETIPGVPQVVKKCVEFVDNYLAETGIYRLSGNSSHIQKLAVKCNEDVFSADIHEARDLNVVTGLLKLYFRELAEPLFTDSFYDSFIGAAKEQDRDARINGIKSLVSQLPVTHRSTLYYLGQHLLRVSEHSTQNKMRINNLAIVFGPTLVRKNSPTMENIIQDSPFQSSIVEEILTQLDWFLEGFAQ